VATTGTERKQAGFIMKLHHAAVVCSSEQKADQFYKTVLGLKKIKQSTLNKDLTEQVFNRARECHVILYGNKDFSIEVFVLGQAAEKSVPYVHLCLEVKDREAFAERCQETGLLVNRVPKGDSLLFFVEDYDGNLFEIKESIMLK